MEIREIIREAVEKNFHILEWNELSESTLTLTGDFLGRPEESSENLAKELMFLGFYPVIRKKNDGHYEVMIMKSPPKKANKYLVNIILFALTILTTLLVGALQKEPGLWGHWVGLFSKIYLGIPFSFTLIFILGSHELGHYFLSKKHHVDATLPYFIPFPHPLVGTLGAFIKIKSPIPSQRALMDIGIAGPLTGAIVALPFTIIGLRLSSFVPLLSQHGNLLIGESLLFKFLTYVTKGSPPHGYDLVLHPMAFAGWLGFFVTALNLIPIGQLDGGHIAYSMLGRKHRIVARVSVLLLVILGFKWLGWWTWALLVFIIGLDHPAPLNEVSTLDNKRKALGVIALILLVLTFIPVPLSMSK